MRFDSLRLACVVACSLALSACAEPQPAPRADPVALPALDAAKPTDLDGLHNVVAYAKDLYSGAAPEGAGFETLRRMGVKTVLSVDGAEPDVAAAKAHGLRYVHLPIGYNGMEKARTLEISRALKDLPGPVYLHCHHGKHRSAGALGAATVTLGLATPEQATARMKVSGTAPHYKGLYACVANASIASPGELAAASTAFPEVWKPAGLVKSMVAADEAFDQLELVEKAGWKAPRDHPDLVPVAQAGRLADLLRNLRDDAQVKAKAKEFLDMLLEGSKLAESLEDGLLKGARPEDLSARFQGLSRSCKSCHDRYRD